MKVSAIVSCYKGEKYLPEFLKNCAEQTLRSETEIVLVHNQPSETEARIVKNYQARYPGLVNYIVVPRESLAVSTNRAIKAAKGEYVCIWNVDDLRTPNSLELMAKTLDENQTTSFTYGDFIIVNNWKSQAGRLISTPEFDKRKFARSMNLGPFYMWRKSWCERFGYWDEQFKSGADFDHSVRLALESQGKKTHGLLGYYLDEGLGLSTGKTPYQPIERTVIELRYGIYHKLDFWYYNRAKQYNVHNLLQNGVWQPIERLAPHYRAFAENKALMVYATLRYPFWLIERAINWTKRRL